MNTLLTPPILDQVASLGDETRVRILAVLDRGEFSVGELAQVLQVQQPSVSRHLRTLAEEGWVEARQDGRLRHYRVAPALDEGARALWDVVRPRLAGEGPWAADRERAAAVVRSRRLRSADFFARAAGRWDELREELFGRDVRFEPLIGLLDPAWTVGDLGSGTGALARLLAPFVARVIGVDRSEEMLEAARQRVEGLGNVELRTGSLEALPIDDGTLDVALVSLVLHYVEDPASVLAEVRRTLRPGGRLIVLDMRLHERGVGYAEEMGHVWPGFAPEALTAWMSEAGFDAPRVHLLPPDPSARGPMLFLAHARAGAPPTR